MDIILPKKRDKFNNIIGFVKVKNLDEAKKVSRGLKEKLLIGNKLSLQLVEDKKDESSIGSDKRKFPSRTMKKEESRRLGLQLGLKDWKF